MDDAPSSTTSTFSPCDHRSLRLPRHAAPPTPDRLSSLGRLDSFPLGAFDHWHVGLFGSSAPITGRVAKRSHGREVDVIMGVCRGRHDAMLLSMLDVKADSEWYHADGRETGLREEYGDEGLRVTTSQRGL